MRSAGSRPRCCCASLRTTSRICWNTCGTRGIATTTSTPCESGASWPRSGRSWSLSTSDAWPRDRGYESRSGDQAIAEFETGRAKLLAELKGLSPEQLARVGIRADGSEVSVLDIIQQLARHDQDHRWRITAILRGFAGLAAPAGAATQNERQDDDTALRRRGSSRCRRSLRAHCVRYRTDLPGAQTEYFQST